MDTLESAAGISRRRMLATSGGALVGASMLGPGRTIAATESHIGDKTPHSQAADTRKIWRGTFLITGILIRNAGMPHYFPPSVRHSARRLWMGDCGTTAVLWTL